MRALLVLACAVALLVPVAEAASPTSLSIVVTADSSEPSERVRWTLRCDPVGGTHPRRVAACRELSRIGWRAFQAPAAGTACAELYGGPQAALVRGTVDGRRVWARLSRIDGCQIARWDRVPSLLPPGGVR